MKNVYYLGPKGTYSQSACEEFCKRFREKTQIQDVSTIAKVVDLTCKNPNAIGIIPIENSIDGIVRPALDSIYKNDIQIQAQLEIKINHCLVSKSKDIKNITHILSHQQAIAQCQTFILNNFDEKIELISTNSTASAGYMLDDLEDCYGSIVSEKLAKELGYNILAKNISDVKDNKTRFVVISKKELNLSKKTRTSFVFNTKNEPGALLKILDIINKHGLNLIYLESRPSKIVFGEYNFFADVDKGIDEIQEALNQIEKQCNFYKLLGSY